MNGRGLGPGGVFRRPGVKNSRATSTADKRIRSAGIASGSFWVDESMVGKHRGGRCLCGLPPIS